MDIPTVFLLYEALWGPYEALMGLKLSLFMCSISMSIGISRYTIYKYILSLYTFMFTFIYTHEEYDAHGLLQSYAKLCKAM